MCNFLTQGIMILINMRIGETLLMTFIYVVKVMTLYQVLIIVRYSQKKLLTKKVHQKSNFWTQLRFNVINPLF